MSAEHSLPFQIIDGGRRPETTALALDPDRFDEAAAAALEDLLARVAALSVVCARANDDAADDLDTAVEMRRFISGAPYLAQRGRGVDVTMARLRDDDPAYADMLLSHLAVLRANAAIRLMVIRSWRADDVSDGGRGDIVEAARARGIDAVAVTAEEAAATLAVAPKDWDAVLAPATLHALFARLVATCAGAGPQAPRLRLSRTGEASFDTVAVRESETLDDGEADPSGVVLAGAWLLARRGAVEAAGALTDALMTAVEDGLHTSETRHHGVYSQCVDTVGFIQAVAERLGRKPRAATPVEWGSHAPSAAPRRTPTRLRLVKG